MDQRLRVHDCPSLSASEECRSWGCQQKEDVTGPTWAMSVQVNQLAISYQGKQDELWDVNGISHMLDAVCGRMQHDDDDVHRMIYWSSTKPTSLLPIAFLH